MNLTPNPSLVAVACGGTGGHLFPGLAVAEELTRRGCDIQLLISPKDVDQQAVRSAVGMEVVTLPAVGLTRGRWLAFARGCLKSYVLSRRCFSQRAPQAVLGMGGFTSVPPVLAGKAVGAVTFLHESNTIPGRANRWLARLVDQAFVGFPSSADRLRARQIATTGTPVRPQFEPTDAASCRMALGLHPERPTLLIMGGSQGARAINDLVLRALPQLIHGEPELQFLHLTGANEADKVRAAYQQRLAKAVVLPFLTEMELALGAASVAVSRAGASSLAECAAMRVPSILIPYPHAADDHQRANARAYAHAGAAWLLEPHQATGEQLATLVLGLLHDPEAHRHMREELERWHAPQAAAVIAEKMLGLMQARGLVDEPETSREPATITPPGRARPRENPQEVVV
jgi:UDP-N-acetylglucosamine--N-acetylmuramyl-(pentapeptide) pyrophosphoryl-undecaprenol N-acetylglucosamine transferase